MICCEKRTLRYSRGSTMLQELPAVFAEDRVTWLEVAFMQLAERV